jgi:hypothetical protein
MFEKLRFRQDECIKTDRLGTEQESMCFFHLAQDRNHFVNTVMNKTFHKRPRISRPAE